MKMHALLVLVVFLFSCNSDGNVPTLHSPHRTLAQAERWSVVDDAELFGLPIEHNLEKLPTEGAAATVPWVGSYWPVYLDSINFPWAGVGSEPASAKFGRAYGIAGIEDAVSRFHGMDMSFGKSCATNYQCGYGAICGRRQHWYTGRCVPGWWGVCQAWAAAAILHEEPRRQVIHNGVQFEINDLKALLTLVYNTAKTKQISMRCELPVGSIPYDAAGRPADLSCRDSNPGTFHLLLTNLLGLRHQAFVEDRSMDQDVWNQPIRAFRVAQMQQISRSRANAALGIGNAEYVYNPSAVNFVFVRMEVYIIKESDARLDGYLGDQVDAFTAMDEYSYVLELDHRNHIIGGEWALNSKSNHPDFLWIPEGPDSAATAGGAISYDDVMDLVRQSY